MPQLLHKLRELVTESRRQRQALEVQAHVTAASQSEYVPNNTVPVFLSKAGRQIPYFTSVLRPEAQKSVSDQYGEVEDPVEMADVPLVKDKVETLPADNAPASKKERKPREKKSKQKSLLREVAEEVGGQAVVDAAGEVVVGVAQTVVKVFE